MTTAITIYLFMHGEELIFEELKLPENMTHTLVSEIGKLGLIDMVDLHTNHETFCEKIEEIKQIFKEKSLNEGNIDFKTNCDQTYFNKFAHKDAKPYLIDAGYSVGIPEYKDSSCLVRILDHNKNYASIVESYEIPQKIYTNNEYNINLLNSEIDSPKKQLIYDELYNCGIYIIETYGLDETKKNEIAQLGFQSRFLPNCLNKNLLFLENLNNLMTIMDTSKIDDFNKCITDLKDARIMKTNSFKGLPLFDGGPFGVYEKIDEINLKAICELFHILGFNHINIVEKACRSIDLKPLNDLPTLAVFKDARPYTLLRQKSRDEIERGRTYTRGSSGGKNKNKKTKRRCKKYKKVIKNQKTKKKQTRQRNK